MYIKITHLFCFLFGHNWLPKEDKFSICKRCKEIKVNVNGIATTLAGWVEGMKHGR